MMSIKERMRKLVGAGKVLDTDWTHLRKYVHPTWQERQERMKRQETKRQANYAKQQAILDHQLASLGRQETLAGKRKRIAELKKKLHPQGSYFQGPEFKFPEPDDLLGKPRRRKQ